MRNAKALPLRAQLTVAMTGCVLATVGIGYGGLTIFGEWQTQAIIAELSPEADRARIAIESGRRPDPKDFAALQGESGTIEATINDGQNWALIILSIMAAGVGAGMGMLLSARLGAPLEGVARAARKITLGDLGARAEASVNGAGEINQLIADFNHMASALESYERSLKANAAAIAHELRTPLTVLRGYVQGAIDGVFVSDTPHLERLLTQIEGLSRLVEDLRTLSLAESGNLGLELQEFDLAQEVVVAADAMRLLLADANMQTDLRLGAVTVRADRIRVRQAVVALLENARRYAASGGVVRVETRAEGGQAILRVLDRGAGMREADLAQGFVSFWRADPSRTKDAGGSGLGLSVVAAILKAHGGSARLSNRDGGGLCVELRFPM
jgi:two-component system, OmpR family, sensor histidine kinase AdeS